MMQLGFSDQKPPPYGTGWFYAKERKGYRLQVIALRKDNPGVSFRWFFWLN